MSIKRELQIGDRVYGMLVPPVKIGLPLCTKTAVLVAPLLSGLGQQVGELTKDKSSEKALQIFAGTISNLDPDKLNLLFDSAFRMSKVSVNGISICDTDLAFEQHFSGYREDLYQVYFWCLWEVVKDFFPIAGIFTQLKTKFMGKLDELMKEESSSPQVGS